MHDTVRASHHARLRYALDKQLPSLRRTVEILTDYGPLYFHHHDAKRIARLVQTLLERQLERLCVTTPKPVTRRR